MLYTASYNNSNNNKDVFNFSCVGHIKKKTEKKHAHTLAHTPAHTHSTFTARRFGFDYSFDVVAHIPVKQSENGAKGTGGRGNYSSR